MNKVVRSQSDDGASGQHSRPGWNKSVLPTVSTILRNPLSLNSDQHQISPCKIGAYSTPEVMRIKDTITQGEFS